MKSTLKRLSAIVLMVMMLINMIPTSAFAATGLADLSGLKVATGITVDYSKPSGAHYCYSDTITLTATGAADGAIYQWQQSSDGVNWNDIVEAVGVGKDQYTFTVTQGTFANAYRVVVKGDADSAAVPSNEVKPSATYEVHARLNSTEQDDLYKLVTSHKVTSNVNESTGELTSMDATIKISYTIPDSGEICVRAANDAVYNVWSMTLAEFGLKDWAANSSGSISAKDEDGFPQNAGSYSVVDGKITFRFSQEFMDKVYLGTEGIRGDFELEGTWTGTKDEETGKVIIHIGDKTYFYYPDGKGDMEVKKNRIALNPITGEATWEVIISSTQGTYGEYKYGDKTYGIKLVDEITDNKNYTKITSMTYEDGSAVVYTKNTAENKFTAYLDNLKPGEGESKKSVKLIVNTVTSGDQAVLTNKTTNLATAYTWDITGAEYNKKSSAEFDLKTNGILNKDVEIVLHNDVKMAQWQIEVNSSTLRSNLAGLTLKDVQYPIFGSAEVREQHRIYGFSVTSSTTTTPTDDYTVSSDGYSITFKETDTTKHENRNNYTFTYYTELKHDAASDSFKDENNALLLKGSSELVKDKASYDQSISQISHISKTATLDSTKSPRVATFKITVNANRWPLPGDYEIDDSWVFPQDKTEHTDGMPDGFSFTGGKVHVNGVEDKTTGRSATTLSDFIDAVNGILEGSKTYEIYYYVSIADGVSGNFQNVATLEGEYGGSDEGPIGVPNLYKFNGDKVGTPDESNDRYKWEITLNSDKNIINNWKLQDDVLSTNTDFLADTPIVITVDGVEKFKDTRADLNAVLSKANEYLVNGSTSTVKITYYSSIKDLNQVSNGVDLYINDVLYLPKDADGNVTSDKSLKDTAQVDVGLSVSKAYVSHTGINDGKDYQINWQASYSLTNTGMDYDITDLDNAYITETPKAGQGQYFKKSDLDQLNFDGLFGANSTAEGAKKNWYIDYDNMTLLEGTTNCYTDLKVKFTHVVKNASATINYKTYMSADAYKKADTINNETKLSVKSGKTQTGKASFVSTEAISIEKNLNSESIVGGNIYGSRLNYTIDADFGTVENLRNFGNTKPTVTDILPEYLVPKYAYIQEIKTSGPDQRWGGVLTPESPYLSVHSGNYTFSYDAANRKITVTSPKLPCFTDDNLNNDMAYYTIVGWRITLQCEIRDDSAYGEDGVAKIKNGAKLQIGSYSAQGWDSERDVIKGYQQDAISKIGNPKEGTNTVNYTVTINPDAKKYLTGGEVGAKTSLRVVDTLSWSDSRFPLSAIKIVDGSVKLTYMDGTPVDGVESKLGSSESGGTKYRTITMDVPDEKAMKLSYSYTITSTVSTDPENSRDNLKLTNTVTLDGVVYEDSGFSSEDFDVVENSKASASTGLISFTKIKKNAEHVLLEGVKYELDAYTSATNHSTVAYGTTNKNGVIVFKKSNGTPFSFATDTTYRLVETETIKGYVLDKTPYIFYIGTNPHGVENATPHSDGAIVKLSNAPVTTKVVITKDWKNANGETLSGENVKYPDTITFTAYNGTTAVKSVVVKKSESAVWPPVKVEITNLEKYNSAGELINYTVKESLLQYYSAAIVDDSDIKDTDTQIDATITNTYVPVSISGTKVWVDGDNRDATRPASITVELYADGQKVQSKSVTPDTNGNWNWSFTDLPKYKQGTNTPIVYTVDEVAVPEYDEPEITGSAADGFTITNTYKPATTQVKVNKVWVDQKLNHGGVTINLLADGTEVDSVDLPQNGSWEHEFKNLPKFKNVNNQAVEIEYTITEDEVEGYTGRVDGFTVTNTELIDIPVTKTWRDTSEASRPASITIRLLADDKPTGKSVTLPQENGSWNWTFEDLPKYKVEDNEVKAIAYTITEDPVLGYASKVDGYNVTNTELTSVSGKKIWDDNNNQDGVRPESITIKLLANGKPAKDADGKTVAALVFDTPAKLEGAAWNFTNLPMYDANGLITYTVEETMTGTKAAYTVTGVGDYDIKNSYKPAERTIEGFKTWDDDGNRDGIRPTKLTITLKADGKSVAERIFNGAEEVANASWKFEKLPVKANGNTINYTIEEKMEGGTPTAYTAVPSQDGYSFTNTHIPAKTSIPVTKTWEDNVWGNDLWGNKGAVGDKTDLCPDSITVILYDVTDYDESNPDSKIEVARKQIYETDDWKGSFDNLPVYKNGGIPIVYDVEEVVPQGFTPVITGDNSGYTINNCLTKTEIEVNKAWFVGKDENGQNKAPASGLSVTVQLMNNGQPIDHEGTEATLNAANGWKYTFANLPEYINGKKANYTVVETKVAGESVVNDKAAGYQRTDTDIVANSYTFTNTELTEASVTKVWVDNDNQEGLRPTSLTVNLLANDQPTGKSVTLNQGNSWTAGITDLLKYDENNNEIIYTWQEELRSEAYKQTGYVQAKGSTPTTLTNTLVQKYLSFEGEKIWEMKGNTHVTKPEITIELWRDGTEIAEEKLNSTDGWTYSFTNLPKYAVKCDELEGYKGTLDGHKFVYEVKEAETVPAYSYAGKTVNTDGTIDFTNTLVTIDIAGSKIWNDNNNQDGLRTESITVRLLADGVAAKNAAGEDIIAIVDEEDNWEWSFTDLPKYQNDGTTEIVYTITEDAVTGYTTGITGTAATGFTITNTHTPDVVSLSGRKIWVDPTGTLHEPITITLVDDEGNIVREDQDGQPLKDLDGNYITNPVTFTRPAVDTASWSFANLPRYKQTADGKTKEISYKVIEGRVDGYTTSAPSATFNKETKVYTSDVTNTIIQEYVPVNGIKTWNDLGNPITVHPEVTIKLFRDKDETEGKNLEPIASTKVVKGEDGTYSYSFGNLPKYAVPCAELNGYTGDLDGHIFSYTVEEVTPAGYSSVKAANGRDFVNTLVPTQVGGTKTWKYAGETMTVFPKLTIKLFAHVGDAAYGPVPYRTQLLEGNDTDYLFENLPQYDAAGNAITYTVEEELPEAYKLGFTAAAGANAERDFVNTLVTVNVNGKKIWDGNKNTITKVPTIKVELLRDGDVIDTATLKDGTTEYAFKNLPKYAVPCNIMAAGGKYAYAKVFDGHIFTYTVREVIVVDNAAKAFESGSVRTATAISGSFTEDFTNKVVTTEVNGTKTWYDMGNDVDRPEVTIQLFRDKDETAGKNLEPIASTKVVKGEDGTYTYSFEDLPKYAVANFEDANGYIGYTGAIDGHEFKYTVEEVVPHGYSSVKTGTAFANTLETVEVKGEKTWIDAGNEKLRPESITIELYRDNKLYKTTKVVKGEDGTYTYSFKNLPKYAIAGLKGKDKLKDDKLDGHVFSYTVKEVLPETYAPAYTPAMAEVASEDENIHIYNFTNTLKTIVVGGVKTWMHSGESFEMYPSITIVLKQDGKEYDRVVLAAGTADADGETVYAFENLPEIDGTTGEAHVYTVEEIIPEPYRDGYVSKTTGDMVNGYEITNTLKTVNVSGKKIWDGNNNTITKVPTIKVELLRDGDVIDTAILENSTTTYAFNNLPKHAVPCDALASYTKDFDGHIFTYTVREVIEEDHEAGYVPSSVRPTTAANGSFTEDFTNKVVTTEVEGTKAWNDMGNEVTHPDVVIELYRDEETAPIATRTLEHGVTAYSFEDLPKYAVANFADANGYIGYTGAIDGHEFVYSVKEVVPHGYTSVQDGTAFANTLETVDVEGTKTWIDLGNEDQRPETITINLMRDGKEYDEVVIAINATNASYSYSFTNLPKFAIAGLADAKEDDVLDGHEFVYTVTEDAVADYDTAIDGYDVTNTISQKFTELEGTKTWIDGNDEAGKRPESIIIRLYRDGEQIDVATVTAADDWAWKFEELAVYGVNVADKGNYTYDDADGHTFVYTVTEDEVPEYSTIQNVNDFTNTIIQDYTDVVGEKTWIDYNNEDGKRPASITVNLLRDGVEIDEVTVGEDEGWAWEFNDLPMYAVEPIDGKTVVYPYDARDGHTFKYTVTEDEVEDYTTEIEGFDVINTLVQEYVEVEGTKTWVDPTGTLHAPITINLLRDGMEVAEIVLENGELEYVFDYLPKYAVPCDELADYTGAMDGHIFTYTVTEDLVPGYTTVQIDTDFINTIEQDWIPVTVNKIWVDNGAVDVEHPAITVHLLRNGTEVASAVLENGVTSHTFTNLMRYNLRTGQPYVYTVTEDPVEGYTTAIDGLTITNTTEGPEMITISGTKTWSGDNGIEHNNAEEVKITLTRRIAGGKVEVVNAPIQWDGATYRFDNLLRADENGNNYIYSIREDLVEGYATYYVGYDIVNRKTYDVVPVEISGTKHWVDNDNERGTRPEQITVHLLRDGVVVDKAVINATGDWNYKFTNLPDNDGFGHYYTYTITEQLVPGYWMMKDGVDLYNTSETPPPPPFPRMRIEELEELLDIFDYGVPLWGGLLGTGDEVPVYPFAFGGAGLLALVAYLLFNRKRNRT